jgi:hypothetical protein
MQLEPNQQVRQKFLIVRELTAYRDQDEGYGLDEFSIPNGDTIFADPTFWHGKFWEGFEVVKFTWGKLWFCSRRSDFEQSTQPC